MKAFTLVFCILALLILSGCNHDAASTSRSASHPVRISSNDVDAAEPGITAATDDSVYVTWVNHQPNGAADVMIARLSSDGQMQGSAARVNTPAGIATAWRGDPPTVAVAADKTVFVAWTARVESSSGQATDLYLSASRDGGQTFSPPVKVNDDAKPAAHGMHSMAVGKDGLIYVAWLDERNVIPVEMSADKDPGMKGHHMESNRELFLATSADGGRTFSVNRRIATDACPCCKTSVTIDSQGRVYVGWRQVLPGDLRHIAVSSSMDQGKTFTTPKIVSDDQWVLAGCPVSGPSLAVDSSDGLKVLWYSAGKNGQTGLYSAESNDAGRSFGPRKLVAAGLTHGTPVLMSNGAALGATWEGSEGTTPKVMTTSLPAGATGTGLAVETGELPAAIQTRQRVFVAYITSTDNRRAVWLVSIPQ